ncbi:MAG: hypothetical protein ACPL1B_03215 [Thermoprotei archaeon]|jgi:hypothetical protein
MQQSRFWCILFSLFIPGLQFWDFWAPNIIKDPCNKERISLLFKSKEIDYIKELQLLIPLVFLVVFIIFYIFLEEKIRFKYKLRDIFYEKK